MENRPGAVDLLLSLNCQLTTNLKGYTAMDFALQNKFAGVALVMVTHPTRYILPSVVFHIAPNILMKCTRGLRAILLQTPLVGLAASIEYSLFYCRGDEILAMTSGKYSSIMLALVATMPQVVQAVLDRCITKSDNKTDSELYHVKFYYFQKLSSERKIKFVFTFSLDQV